MATVKVRYWAAAKEAAGVAEEPVEAANLGELMTKITADRETLAAVMKRASFLVDGRAVGRRAHADVELGEGAVVEVLPAFAGG
ncbi:MoaD/ThiS family protein [Nonomuraea longicatena]|uniref:MoaD/ThiS family protein n=1 Tax=Nonomuraea longicatena TaxID=83682 RepID=A0ABN1QTE9_9ACTN